MSSRSELTGKKSHKKAVIIGVVAALAAAGVGGFFTWKHFKNASDAGMEAVGAMPEPVVRTSIESLYSATGKVISSDCADANAVKTGDSQYPISEVKVAVGDNVKKGDILYTLDMTSIENDIALQEQKIALTQSSNAIDQSAAGRAYSNAQSVSGQTYEDETRKLQRSADDTNKLLQDQIDAQKKLDDAITKENNTKGTYDGLLAAYNAKKAEQEKKQQQIFDKEREMINNGTESAATGGTEGTYSSDEDYANLTLDMSIITNDLTALTTAKGDAETAYTTAKADREAAEKELEAVKDKIQAQVRALEDQGSSTLTTNRTTVEAQAAAGDSAAKQRIAGKSGLLDLQEQLKKSQQTLENGVVKANIDGTVTAVNIYPGQIYTGDAAVVINNIERMKVTAEIDEGHIADISKGTKVRVQTDSTGDDKLTGEVVFTALSPTQIDSVTTANGKQSSTDTSTKKATYRVEIQLDEPNDRLRMGMNARIDFITASAQDVLAVPSSCITTYPDGTKALTLASGDEGAESATAEAADMGMPGGNEIIITTGVSDDYYTEITSDNVAEGEMVQSTAGDMMSTDGLMDGIY